MASEIGRRPALSHVLVIGIDDYAHCPKLHGAVADAKAMEQYFKEVLQVPSGRICTLYNEGATRKAIIQAFDNLRRDNVPIEKGEPIVIFYAGHGGELIAPESWWVTNQVIQCLIPQDCESMRGRAGIEPVEGHAPIPDRTIGVLLEDIAKLRGDNITVIFDCCHSASGTREEGYVPRAVQLKDLIISEDLDGTIWKGRAGKIHDGFVYHGLRSHVLLAACREKELAYEHESRGQFTRALLEILKRCAENKLDLSYAEVLERIRLNKRQHPQCEGQNRHRILFDRRVPAGRLVWHSAQAKDGKCVIDAGLSHGVAPGMEISVYDDEKHRMGVVLIDGTSSVGDFQTTVTTSLDLKNVKHGKVARVGKVPIYIGNYPALEEALQSMEGNDANAPKFRVVDKMEEARLQLAMENNQVVFKILDERVRRLGLTELPHKTTLENLVHVLPAAAHFFWYLDLENKKSRLGANHEVTVNFYLLRGNYDDFGTLFFTLIEPGFCRKDPSSGNSDVIDFVVSPTGRYGIEVKNNTEKDLYLNAFLFNNSSLSVASYYTQASSGEPEAPLKRGETFTIGYGSAGIPPFMYSLEDGQDVDVGYLKIFLSTLPIDLFDIEQPSAFSNVHPPPAQDRRDANPLKKWTGTRPIWFTVLIPVVQRRQT